MLKKRKKTNTKTNTQKNTKKNKSIKKDKKIIKKTPLKKSRKPAIGLIKIYVYFKISTQYFYKKPNWGNYEKWQQHPHQQKEW